MKLVIQQGPCARPRQCFCPKCDWLFSYLLISQQGPCATKTKQLLHKVHLTADLQNRCRCLPRTGVQIIGFCAKLGLHLLSRILITCYHKKLIIRNSTPILTRFMDEFGGLFLYSKLVIKLECFICLIIYCLRYSLHFIQHNLRS